MQWRQFFHRLSVVCDPIHPMHPILTKIIVLHKSRQNSTSHKMWQLMWADCATESWLFLFWFGSAIQSTNLFWNAWPLTLILKWCLLESSGIFTVSESLYYILRSGIPLVWCQKVFQHVSKQQLFFPIQILNVLVYHIEEYGISGCGVFKAGIQN